MTKLEWCRKAAPPCFRGLSDGEIMEVMDSAYRQYCIDEAEDFDTDGEEGENLAKAGEEPGDGAHDGRNETNNSLDYMVVALCRAFGDRLAFKGGYMLTKLMPDVARQTADIDFSILSAEIYQEIKSVLIEICGHFMETGVIDAYKIKDSIGPRMSGGADMYKGGQKVLGVDVGWHDITYGTKKISLDVAEVNAFTIERMLSDKITAILSNKRFRRPKDLYDVFCISECFDFEIGMVNEFILRRTEGVGADWQNFPFNDIVVREYKKAYDKLGITSVYKSHAIVKPEFEAVFERFCAIADKCANPVSGTHWDSGAKYFIS